MQKQTIDGLEIEFELADENFQKDRVMSFYVKSLNGSEYDKYHVVIGKTEDDVPKNPIDGHTCAICLIRQDAIMVASAIRIAITFEDIHKFITGDMVTGDMVQQQGTSTR